MQKRASSTHAGRLLLGRVTPAMIGECWRIWNDGIGVAWRFVASLDRQKRRDPDDARHLLIIISTFKPALLGYEHMVKTLCAEFQSNK